ncbi:MAG: DUF484 domain-containing protein [Lysobacterales bacterium CG02_land_8_20_14_3_00_62_12]|nr:MAG: DUF484 domain-containing protein [Xanthomonadales bacterium CG02_land_8_20_14_3_00_62_12]
MSTEHSGRELPIRDPTARRELNALDVAGFLRRHPEFLAEFPDLALSLALPRQQGASTSLASYQLDVLRDKTRALSRRLQELIGIAQDNEHLMVRVHAFTLSLMRAGTLADTLSRVVATLTEDFHTDLVRLCLFEGVPDFHADWLKVAARDEPGLRPFTEFFAAGEPLCGRLNADKLGFLFGPYGEQVKSAVLLPIADRGLLAIGSHDPNRFHPGMGTIFLKLISEAVGVALARYSH